MTILEDMVTIDIAERLRAWEKDQWRDTIHKDAADEIERLRAALRQMVDDCDLYSGSPLNSTMVQARAALEKKD